MIDGQTLKNAYMSAAVTISNRRREVDELNVYPVPDGDTGTNMSMTMNNALKELEQSADGLGAGRVADICASALLRGARGNSGVILSLLFRGISKGFEGKENASCNDIAEALKIGVENAYKAVMKPTEGTILTVARMAAQKAAEAAKTTDDTAELWGEVCKAAQDALAKTKEQLDVLKKADVVDAGGKGLVIIFDAMRDVFMGKEPVKPDYKTSSAAAASLNTTVGDFDDDVITFGYCTEFIVKKSRDCADASRLKAFLGTIGDCVFVVDDDNIIKVHVHTDHPGQAIEEGLTFGQLVNMKIDNLREQHENKAKDARVAHERHIVPAEPVKPFGFAAVANGAGVEEMFRNLGADHIIRGGQTMNPSTDDIINAAYLVPAETVFVLPNNKNIIMAAEQAVKLSDRRICVIPSRTIPQGITAMMNYDPDGDLDSNRLNMTKSMENVSTGLVTFAARDSELDGKQIKKGEILGLENGKLGVIEKDVNKAAYKVIRKLAKGSAAYITVIYGADVTDEKAEELQQLVTSKFGQAADVNFINGGQPVYYYIISVE